MSSKERIFRKTTTTEMIERPVKSEQATFTTKPKTRRHLKHSISGTRAKHFMEHLWRIGFETCNYKALQIQFIQFFGTNDPRVIMKYLGRPATTEKHSGNQILRVNMTQGKHAVFSYSNTRKLKAKTGLMEMLGYLTLNKKNGNVKIHHKKMSYYMQQVRLTHYVSPQTPLSRSNECKSSIQDYCVRHIETGETTGRQLVKGSSRRKKEEEVIEHTHKSSMERPTQKSVTLHTKKRGVIE